MSVCMVIHHICMVQAILFSIFEPFAFNFQNSKWNLYFMNKYWVMGSWDLEIKGAEPSDSAVYRWGRFDSQTSQFETYRLANVKVYGIKFLFLG